MGDQRIVIKSQSRFSLKNQFIVTFLLILITSVIMTMVTYASIRALVRPVNLNERLIGVATEFIRSHQTALLSPQSAKQLQQVLSPSDVSYQITNADGRRIYGTLMSRVLFSRTQLQQKVNTQDIESPIFLSGTQVTRYLPIFDQKGEIAGAAIIQYHPVPTLGRFHGTWIYAVFVLTIFAVPFIYVLLFTYIFARSFGRRINQPLQSIVSAARRIQSRDLDFVIEHNSHHEIGALLTAFEEMHRALKDALFTQWRLEQERRDMIAALAHDLGTPITIIQGHVESLLEGQIQDDQRKTRYLQTIGRNTSRVVHLIEEMQAVSDIDTPSFALRPSAFDLPTFIDDKRHEYEIALHEKQLSVSVNTVDRRTSQERFHADESRLAQILDNIMSNAIRYTPTGGHISWDVVLDDDRCTMAVCDSGPGFTEQDLVHAFQKFYRGDGSRSKEQGHTGLGMYITKVLVEKHNGSIHLKDSPNGGACVEFTVRTIRP